jgi:hypothetical protein
MKKEIELDFATTIGENEVDQIKNTLEEYGIPYEIKNEAKNVAGETLENSCELYLPKTANEFTIFNLIN